MSSSITRTGSLVVFESTIVYSNSFSNIEPTASSGMGRIALPPGLDFGWYKIIFGFISFTTIEFASQLSACRHISGTLRSHARPTPRGTHSFHPAKYRGAVCHAHCPRRDESNTDAPRIARDRGKPAKPQLRGIILREAAQLGRRFGDKARFKIVCVRFNRCFH